MGGLGRQNPLPFQIGGGQSETERIWLALRDALGEDGAGPVEGLEDAWRLAKVAGLVKATTMGRRALCQYFPDLATDHLSVWEDALKLASEDDDELRRQAVAAAVTFKASALIPTLRTRLQAINADVDIVTQTEATNVHFMPTKYLRPRTEPGQTRYGDQAAAQFPAFSSYFIVTVLWSGLGSSDPPPSDLAKVEGLLNRSLPSWVDYRIINRSGFYLDGYNDSRLDLTAF